jgi:vacuolar-type H+-ATPase subunit I/STV1
MEREKFNSQGESNLSVLLNRRLLELADSKAQPQHNEENIGRRTISALVEDSKVWNEKKKKEEQHKAKLARLRELEDLASKKDSIWDEIESLLKEKKASAYKNAVNLLIDLHDLAEYQGDLKHFKEQLEDLRKNYANRPALIRRMKEAKLIF